MHQIMCERLDKMKLIYTYIYSFYVPTYILLYCYVEIRKLKTPSWTVLSPVFHQHIFCYYNPHPRSTTAHNSYINYLFNNISIILSTSTRTYSFCCVQYFDPVWIWIRNNIAPIIRHSLKRCMICTDVNRMLLMYIYYTCIYVDDDELYLLSRN